MKSNPFAVPFDLDECNRRCKSSMLNTPTGKWLAAACLEIERLRKELADAKANERMAEMRGMATMIAGKDNPPSPKDKRNAAPR